MDEPSSRGVDRLIPVLIAIFLAYSCASLARDIRYILIKAPDDASYFLRIAQNVTEGYGWTFDRINHTNGFQPLWQLVLVGLRLVLPVAPEAMFRIVLVVQSLMLTVASWLLWRTMRPVAGAWPAALAAVLFLGTVYLPARSGMDSAILLLVVTLFLAWSTAYRLYEPGSSAPTFGTGGLLGLVMLARLDSVFVVAAMVLMMSWSVLRNARTGRTREYTRLAQGCAVAAAVVAPYLAFNAVAFGRLMPVSGAIKSSFPRPGWFYPDLQLSGEGRLAFLAVTALSLVFLVWRCTRASRSAHAFWRNEVTALSAGVLAHHLFSVLFMKWAVFGWHFILSRLLLCFLVPFFLQQALARFPTRICRVGWSACATGVALLSALMIYDRDWRRGLDSSWQVTSYEAAKWVDRELPRNAILAMKDAGNMGYFSGRRVVDLDGVANSFEYQDALKQGQFAAFLRQDGVQYFVQHAFSDDSGVNEGRYERLKFAAYSHLYDQPGGFIVLQRAAEVYRSRPYSDDTHRTVLVIWRLAE